MQATDSITKNERLWLPSFEVDIKKSLMLVKFWAMHEFMLYIFKVHMGVLVD